MERILNGDYGIDTDGNIFSYKSNKYLKSFKTGSDLKYLKVSLCINGIPKNYYIHRLVAQTFIPNPNNYEQINHKDENSFNNNVNNLEWCTAKYNCNYGTRIKRFSTKKKKPVDMFTKDGIYEKSYISAADADRETGISFSNISACCRGKINYACGHIWKFSNGTYNRVEKDV